MKDDTETELGKYIYQYAPVGKTEIDLAVLDDLAYSFCIREGYLYRGYMHIDTVLWVLIGMRAEQECMSMYTEYRKSFEVHGYSAPRLSIELI